MSSLPNDLKDQALKKFKEYDFDKSNFIDLRELRTLMIDLAKELKLGEPSDDEIYQILKDTDTNKDKKISFEEFIELFEMMYVMKI